MQMLDVGRIILPGQDAHRALDGLTLFIIDGLMPKTIVLFANELIEMINKRAP